MWGHMRELAFEAEVQLIETPMSWLTRGFTFKGDPINVRRVELYLEDLNEKVSRND
jgi:hypothetical protein